MTWVVQDGMTLEEMIEECYNLRLDGVSPAQPHFASTGALVPPRPPRAPPAHTSPSTPPHPTLFCPRSRRG